MPTDLGRDGVTRIQHTPDPATNTGALPGTLLTADVVHDLRNALTVVLSSIEQLRRQPLDARGQQQLERAYWGAQHAGQLTSALLVSGLSLGGGKSPENTEIMDLNVVVNAFTTTMGRTVDGGATFAMELSSGPLLAQFNRSELERALLNLIRNAAEATPHGGKVTIRTAHSGPIDSADEGSTVEVAVTDTGTGMASEAAQRAGEAFFTTKGPGRGTGLGLWAVRRFAENAGGTVEIETALGKGTTVRLILPQAG